MRIVIALGGNALLRRGEPMTTEVQRRNIMVAAKAIAPLAAEHSIVVVHGNGPQVGLLSLQAESYAGAEPYPLDVLDAGTQGMIGYLIQQELRSLLPPEQQVATLLTMIVVDPARPGVRPSDEVRRSGLRQGRRRQAGGREGLDVPAGRIGLAPGGALARAAADPGDRSRSPGCLTGGPWSSALAAGASRPCTRRRVPAPWWASKRSSTRTWPANCWPRTCTRTCSSWPPTWTASTWAGVRREQRRLDRVTPEELAGHQFAAGSMGPKVEAAARFAAKTGQRAAIGSLADIAGIVAGTAGTNVIAHGA